MNNGRITEGNRISMGLSRRHLLQLASLAPALTLRSFPALAQDRKFVHGLTLFESLKYPADFKQFAYVNAAAPKGGKLRLGQLGSFDSLNGNTLKGDPIDPGRERDPDDAFA